MAERHYRKTIDRVLDAIPDAVLRAYAYLCDHPIAAAACAFAFFFLVFQWMYLPTTFLASSDDHFFHFRFAEAMRDQGFFNAFANFKSIYFSKMAQGIYYPYYNFLFYLVVIPFTYITPLYLGIKLYALCAVSVFFTALYLVLRNLKVRGAFLWLLAFIALVQTSSIWRLFLSRPYVLAPIFLIVIVLFMYRRKYVWAGVASCIYFFWYDATFFFPACVAVVYAVFADLYGAPRAWRGALYAIGGVAAAVVLVSLIAPGFFSFMTGVIFSAATTPLRNINIPEGGELYPINIIDYVRNNSLLISFLIIGFFSEVAIYLRMRRDGMTEQDHEGYPELRATLIFLAAGFFAAAVVVSGRFSDYIVPFLALYLILAVSTLAKRFTLPDTLMARSLGMGLVVAVLYLFGVSLLAVNDFIANNGSPIEVLEGVGTWLDDNTQPGDIVFNVSWNWFPQLYYWSPKDNYVTGLEPRFLYDDSPRLYYLWANIGNGYVCDTNYCGDLATQAAYVYNHPNSPQATAWYKTEGDAIAGMLTDDFQSHYLMSSYEFSFLNTVLDHNAHFTKVYGGNRTYYIYKVTP